MAQSILNYNSVVDITRDYNVLTDMNASSADRENSGILIYNNIKRYVAELQLPSRKYTRAGFLSGGFSDYDLITETKIQADLVTNVLPAAFHDDYLKNASGTDSVIFVNSLGLDFASADATINPFGIQTIFMLRTPRSYIISPRIQLELSNL